MRAGLQELSERRIEAGKVDVSDAVAFRRPYQPSHPAGWPKISGHPKCGNVGGSHTPGCCIVETALAGWGGKIRTSAWRNQNPTNSHFQSEHILMCINHLARTSEHGRPVCRAAYRVITWDTGMKSAASKRSYCRRPLGGCGRTGKNPHLASGFALSASWRPCRPSPSLPPTRCRDMLQPSRAIPRHRASRKCRSNPPDRKTQP
jgi:hypothetical protein